MHDYYMQNLREHDFADDLFPFRPVNIKWSIKQTYELVSFPKETRELVISC